jgi:hypothetical protein
MTVIPFPAPSIASTCTGEFLECPLEVVLFVVGCFPLEFAGAGFFFVGSEGWTVDLGLALVIGAGFPAPSAPIGVKTAPVLFEVVFDEVFWEAAVDALAAATVATIAGRWDTLVGAGRAAAAAGEETLIVTGFEGESVVIPVPFEAIPVPFEAPVEGSTPPPPSPDVVPSVEPFPADPAAAPAASWTPCWYAWSAASVPDAPPVVEPLWERRSSAPMPPPAITATLFFLKNDPFFPSAEWCSVSGVWFTAIPCSYLRYVR